MPIHNRHYIDSSSHQHTPSALAAVGAILEVQIQVPKALADLLESQNQTIPSPVVGFALIDTGATRSCADQSALSSLGINPIGLVAMGTAGGPTQCQLFPARLWFPSLNLGAAFDSIVGVDLQGQVAQGKPLIVLIGRDVLARGPLVYSGNGGFFTLAFS
jgi:hypothetical protein